MLIYIAGPLAAPTRLQTHMNAKAAMGAGRRVIDRGHWPLIPHLNLMWSEWCDEAHGGTLTWEEFLTWDEEILRRCDALYYLGSSPGADRELQFALDLKLPVYRSLDDIPLGKPLVGGVRRG